MAIQNMVFHVVLPKGLRLTNGAYLGEPATYDVVSALLPYYCSVDQVRLIGGLPIRRLSDLTIASMIYDASKEVDLLYPPGAQVTFSNSPNIFRFYGSRQQYTINMAALHLIQSIMGLINLPGSHILANFSVTREKPNLHEGIAGQIEGLQDRLKLYEVTIRSGGNVVPGGKAKAQFAAKGVFDWTERTPARTWIATGMGANATSQDFGSPTGGRGKPSKFFSSPFYSPPIVNMRTGIYQGAYPLITVYPYPQNSP